MPETTKSLLRRLSERKPRIALAAAGVILLGIAGPASAQFFNFGGPPPRAQRGGGGGGFGDGFFGGGGGGADFPFFAPFQRAPRRQVVREDYSKPPAPEKRETVPERNVLVLGDAMADWLAYGLEDAYNETPDMGVIRRGKTYSGLIKYQPKGDPADWVAAAKGILATEKPDAIVVMLGLNDRVSLREPAPEKSDKKDGDKKDAKAKPEAKSDAKADGKSTAKPIDADDAKIESKPAADPSADDGDIADPAPIVTEKGSRSPNGVYEFRDDRWVELYTKKIEDMIRVLKTKGVPILWVGLPALRGAKATSDMLFLDAIYRDAAGKAGIVYVDVWDGFVDEAGRFLQQGPDFEGQIRRLRSYDGVYFTKPGARKLAHYVEREVTRVLASRSAPVAIPTEPAAPEATLEPGKPAQRPLAGPIVPLVASTANSDQLLGGPGSRPIAVDVLASRTLVKGEALIAPAGRADDQAWPRREVGRERAPQGDPTVASIQPLSGSTAAGVDNAGLAPGAVNPLAPPKPKRPRPVVQNNNAFQGFFGFQNAPAQQQAPARQRVAPRPAGSVGPSASVPGFFTR